MNQTTDVVRIEVGIALDLRQFKFRIDEKNRPHQMLRLVWPEIAGNLIGRRITPGETIHATTRRGEWRLIVMDLDEAITITENTRFCVIDIERQPEIRHACKEHAEKNEIVFGPFFCPVCREQNLPDRLCELHAHFLENKYTAYCQTHTPHCQCRADCDDYAEFECDYCRRPFAAKWKRYHPNDPLTLLCHNCYSYHFELCAECERMGKKRLGKSRCAFPLGEGSDRHGRRLCTREHAWQWQVWGPHWRGVVLCEQHYRGLSRASATDLLWMMLSTRPPAPFLRGKITDAYRLRNIVGYVRQQELSWSEMREVLNNLSEKADRLKSPSQVRDNINSLLHNLEDAQDNLAIEGKLLTVVRDFYRRELRISPEAAILGVTIKRVFGGRDKLQTYRIGIRVGQDAYNRPYKGLLIGKGGELVNKLRGELKQHAVEGVDFED